MADAKWCCWHGGWPAVGKWSPICKTNTPQACVCVRGKDTETHTFYPITGRMALGVGGTAEAVTVLVNAIGSFALRGGTENKTHFLSGWTTDSSYAGKKRKNKRQKGIHSLLCLGAQESGVSWCEANDKRGLICVWLVEKASIIVRRWNVAGSRKSLVRRQNTHKSAAPMSHWKDSIYCMWGK